MNQSLQKTSKIFDILMQRKKPVGVNEFSEILQIPKSTISRFLSTLESLGFVRRDPETGRFYLGLKLFELGCKAMEDLGLREVAIPQMESLRDRLNENVLLTVLEGTHITYLDKIESQQVVIIQTNLGGTAPAYCVSGGKAMVAHFPERIEEIIAGGLKKFTANTITDPEKFRRECQNIREQGYAINKGELRIDVHGVGTPIFNARGDVVGAISTAVPASRMSKELLEEHIEAVTRTGNDISRLLGFSGLK